MNAPGPLGRRLPQDDEHLRKYALAALAPTPPATVERVLALPPYRKQYDQGQEGACVGYGTTWAMSIWHAAKNPHGHYVFPRFDPEWLYHEAQKVDGFADTPPAEGTTVRAAFDVLRAQGDRRIVARHDNPPDLAFGVHENRWATAIDEVRAAIDAGTPVTIGVNWYENFDEPIAVPRGKSAEYWIGRNDLGKIRGGHCVCLYGASDQRQAVRLVNNWGADWPLVWLPYATLERLLNEDGEAAVIIA